MRSQWNAGISEWLLTRAYGDGRARCGDIIMWHEFPRGPGLARRSNTRDNIAKLSRLVYTIYLGLSPQTYRHPQKVGYLGSPRSFCLGVANRTKIEPRSENHAA